MQKRKKSIWYLAWLVSVSVLACTGQQSQQNAKMAAARRGIGEAYMRQGDYTSALGKLLETEKLNPKDPIVHHDLGLCYRAKNRMPDALAHLEKAVTLKPSFSAARNTLGRVYIETGAYDKAITTLKELTGDVLYGTPHFPLSNLGEAYYHKKDYAKAIEYYKQSLKISPKFIPALHGMGRTYVALGRGRIALMYLERALKLSPNMPEIHYDAAKAYEIMGRIGQARISYQSVIQLAPSESKIAVKASQQLRVLR